MKIPFWKFPRKDKFRYPPPFPSKRKGGQALVEFAIILLLFVFLVLGTISMGRGVFSLIVVTNAAREGAYCMAYNPLCDLGAAVDREINSGTYSPGLVKISNTASNCMMYQNCTVEVKACVSHFYIINFSSSGNHCNDDGLEITGRVIMPVVAK
jgi:hypothetical protein